MRPFNITNVKLAILLQKKISHFERHEKTEKTQKKT